MEFRKDVYGWFDDPYSEIPSHDPGIENGICPLCGTKLERPVMTTSFTIPGSEKSYFYRVHKECQMKASEEEISDIEGVVIDEISKYTKWDGITGLNIK